MSEFVVYLTYTPNKTVKGPASSDELAYLCGLPPVREQIVRCKDCRRTSVGTARTDLGEPLLCHRTGSYVRPDGYCAWGVSKVVTS